MDIVLGVSMTPAAVRMVLVEGKSADGVTLDHDSFDVAAGVSTAISDAPEQVVAAVLGTRESAAEGGHHLVSTGIAWTDHAAAARLSQALRAQRVDDVILVSELHAASALAQAIGEAADYDRTALLFVERDAATLAVVRTFDGSVVKVTSGPRTTPAELRAMVTGLEAGSQPPQALFVVGSGVDAVALKSQIADSTALPVHAPDDGDLALARGAALAAANTPRYEASTVGLPASDDTAAGPTQMAAAGYMAPLGYSAVPDDDDESLDDLVNSEPAADADPTADRRPFLLVGSALSTVFVVGVVALAISLAVAIRPTADQRPTPGSSAVVSNSVPAPPQAQQPPPPAEAPETIQAPIPVVQEVPRTVLVAPRDAAPAALPPAPPPAADPAPAPVAPAPAPAPVPAQVPAPAPVIAPPIVVPVPIIAPALPPIFQIPPRLNPRSPATTAPSTVVPSTPSTESAPSTPAPSAAPSTQAPSTQAPSTQGPESPAPPTTTIPTYTAPVTQAPADGSETETSSGSATGSWSGRGSSGSNTVWPPLWPFAG